MPYGDEEKVYGSADLAQALKDGDADDDHDAADAADGGDEDEDKTLRMISFPADGSKQFCNSSSADELSHGPALNFLAKPTPRPET